MKTLTLKHLRSLSALCWTLLALGSAASGQTPAGLSIQSYAGLTVTGAVGTVYSIEYVTDLAQTNTPFVFDGPKRIRFVATRYDELFNRELLRVEIEIVEEERPTQVPGEKK